MEQTILAAQTLLQTCNSGRHGRNLSDQRTSAAFSSSSQRQWQHSAAAHTGLVTVLAVTARPGPDSRRRPVQTAVRAVQLTPAHTLSARGWCVQLSCCPITHPKHQKEEDLSSKTRALTATDTNLPSMRC